MDQPCACEGKSLPPVAIIIPFPEWDDWTAECVERCSQLDYPDVALWLLPDNPLTDQQLLEARRLSAPRLLHVKPTGKVNPAKKRNVALRCIQTAWSALIDADAYPRPDWLRNAFSVVSNDVGIVAGPNVTPPHDPWARQLSGLVMRSPLGFGPAYIRHHPVPAHGPEEMPTCNMLIRMIPGLLFREEFSTAEDMMYCLDTRSQGYRIVYSPDVVVYHHRRRFPRDLARQFFFYGRDKGRLFARRSPVSRFSHAMPALVLLYGVLLMTVGVFIDVDGWMLAPGIMYGMLVIIESVRCACNGAVALGGLMAFPLAHAAYGWGFLRGLPVGWREKQNESLPHPD